jgi:hypothetical protein
MAAVQAYVLLDYPVWRAWLIPAIVGLNLGAAVFLALARLRDRGLGRRASYPAVAAGVGVLALLFAPAAWAAHDVLSSQGGGGMGLPSAGPRSAQAFGPPGGHRPAGLPRAVGLREAVLVVVRAVRAAGTRILRWWSTCRPTGAMQGIW